MILRITAKYPHDEVKQVITFAAKFAQVNHAGLVVKVKNSRSICRGMAYPCVITDKDYKLGGTQLVTLGIGKPFRFPYWVKDLKFDTWQECLAWLAGHEFAHIYAFQNTSVRQGERLANWYGQKCLEAWRERLSPLSH